MPREKARSFICTKSWLVMLNLVGSEFPSLRPVKRKRGNFLGIEFVACWGCLPLHPQNTFDC